MNALFRALVLAVISVALAGCSTDDSFFLTQRLWEDGRFRSFHEPAAEPRVRVFRSEDPPDYLVTYDEVRERDGRIRARAFYLSTVAQRRHAPPGRRPKFVDPGLAGALREVPLRGGLGDSAATQTGAAVWLESTDGGASWAIHESGGVVGEFALPVYPARGATALKIVLTPLALTGDAVIVGAIVGVFVASVYAQGHWHGSSSH